MKVYAIRHIPTGLFMPVPTGKNGSGSSYWDPIDSSACDVIFGPLPTVPRLFPLRRSASSALTQWLRGQHKPIEVRECGDDFGNYHIVSDGVEVVPIPERKADDMEIVVFELVEAK